MLFLKSNIFNIYILSLFKNKNSKKYLLVFKKNHFENIFGRYLFYIYIKFLMKSLDIILLKIKLRKGTDNCQ